MKSGVHEPGFFVDTPLENLYYFLVFMPIYISSKGLQELKDEVVDRKTIQRRAIAERISAAKDLGDLSENFEYHEAKEEQGLNEARISQLENMFHDAVIVDETSGGEMIGLGATFVVEVNGQEKTYSMVGSSEANPIAGKISNESPIGAAFFARKVGETVEVSTPGGSISYRIKDIH